MVNVDGLMLYRIAVSQNALGKIPMSLGNFMIFCQHVFYDIEGNGSDSFIVFDRTIDKLSNKLSILFGKQFYIARIDATIDNMNHFRNDYILNIDSFQKILLVGTFDESTIVIQKLKE